MRKFLSLITTACLALSMLAGCQSNSVEGSSTTVNQSTNSNNLKVVSTIFPLYDWTKEITDGGNVDLTLLVDNGVDLHSYQVTTEDIMSIKTADVVIYLGSSSDSWVEDALAENANPNVVVINALELIGQENLLEGDHVHDETCEHDHEEEHV
ncbi:MAG: metal ABC transporter substrate-binding protein, partial [Clostridia bacterium]